MDLLHDQQTINESIENHDIQTLVEILPSNIKDHLVSLEFDGGAQALVPRVDLVRLGAQILSGKSGDLLALLIHGWQRLCLLEARADVLGFHAGPSGQRIGFAAIIHSDDTAPVSPPSFGSASALASCWTMLGAR